MSGDNSPLLHKPMKQLELFIKEANAEIDRLTEEVYEPCEWDYCPKQCENCEECPMYKVLIAQKNYKRALIKAIDEANELNN